MTRSTERVAPRSGSLERRRSGEDSPVLNQSTVHGFASPSHRPTLFDVFRPRAKAEAKQARREKDIQKSSSSDKDNSSPASSTHSGSGGIMQTMKSAIQHTGLIGGHRHHSGNSGGTTATPKYNRDGSAHPHSGSGGSDAQVNFYLNCICIWISMGFQYLIAFVLYSPFPKNIIAAWTHYFGVRSKRVTWKDPFLKEWLSFLML